jgi:hypothetical protein
MAYGDRQLARTTFKGPVAGGYQTFVLCWDEPTVAATAHPGNGSMFHYVVAPFACRAEEVSTIMDARTIVGSLAVVVRNVTTSVDICPSTSVSTADTAVTVAAASLTNRDIAKGDLLRFAFVGTNAGDEVIRGSISLTVWIKGHCAALEAND